MTSLPIPSTPSEITAEWLRGAVREGGLIRGTDEVTLTDIEPAGAGATGGVFRVRFAVGAPADRVSMSVVAKLPDPHPDVRRIANDAALATTEIRFYRELAAHCGWRTPRLLFAAHDGDRSILLLEDLAPARSGPPPEGTYPHEARRLMQRLATFHARWWNAHEIAALDWLRPYGPARSFATNLGSAWRELQRDFSGQFPPEVTAVTSDARSVALVDALIDRWDDVGARLCESPWTLIHGDYGPHNMAVDGASPDPYIAFDFQLAARARAGWEVAHFTYTSSLRDSLDVYAERLAFNQRNYIEALRARGVNDYSQAELAEDCGWYSGWMTLVLLWLYWASFKRGRPQPSSPVSTGRDHSSSQPTSTCSLGSHDCRNSRAHRRRGREPGVARHRPTAICAPPSPRPVARARPRRHTSSGATSVPGPDTVPSARRARPTPPAPWSASRG